MGAMPASRRAARRWTFGRPGARAPLAALLAAAACDGGGATPPAGGPIGGPCDLRLTEVALYQAVKIPLARAGGLVAPRNADVVQGRKALVRAFVEPTAGPASREAELKLVLQDARGERMFTERKRIVGASLDVDAASTFNFTIDGAEIGPDTTWSVEIAGPTSCQERGAAGARLPAEGTGPLDAKDTGALRVRIVPIQYDADGSQRLPDASEAQLEQFRAQLLAAYPVREVELSLREPVATSTTLDEEGWDQLLDQLREVRARDRAPADLYYFGLVAPTASSEEYCKSGHAAAGCTSGIAYRAALGAPSLRVGLGLGFPGSTAAHTFVHEIGHAHGLGHSPCGLSGEFDRAFPHAGGGIGSWGWNAQTGALLNPAVYKDLMGYCMRPWVSDYTYQALLVRSLAVNAAPARQALSLEGPPPAAGARTLVVDGRGGARWGRPPAPELAAGRPEPAVALDAAGRRVEEILVHRTEVGEGRALVLVPSPRPAWHAVQIAGTPPVPFAAPTAPALRPARPRRP